MPDATAVGSRDGHFPRGQHDGQSLGSLGSKTHHIARSLVLSHFRYSCIALRPLRVEHTGTGRSCGNEGPHKLLREPGKDFLRRQNRKF